MTLTLLDRIFSRLWRSVDLLIGTGDIDNNVRGRLLSEQIEGVVRMAPAMASGSVVVVVFMLAVASETSSVRATVVWAVAMAASLGVGIRSWRQFRKNGERRLNPTKAARRALINAIGLGVLWGIMPVILMPVATPEMSIAVPVAMTAILFGGAMAYSSLPQAAFAFQIPVVIGGLIGTRLMQDGYIANLMALLLLCFVPIMGAIIVRWSESFVAHVLREMKFHDQKTVISLLLSEFEENSSDWLWEFGSDGKMDRVSERFAAAIGRPESELLGKDFMEFLQSVMAPEDPHSGEIAAAVESRQTFNGIEIVIDTDEKQAIWRITGKAVYDVDGEYAGYIGTASDITTAKTAEKKANYLAHYDALTGLFNRSRFSETLNQCVSRLERYGAPFSVFYLDLDRFKLVNDSSGHLAGDRLLVEVARRIREEVRESDVVARLGGDEFAILLPNLAEITEASALAERLVQSIEQPFDIDGENLSIGLSIGIAMAPTNGTRPDQILRNADLALYRAKDEGRGRFRFFEAEMDSSARERRMLEIELRQALKAGELVLYYQPLVSADDGITTGFEALVRWDHPIRGIVPPAEFIPIAEQSGLIKEIGDWTIREACMAASQWPGGLSVSVNLSSKHFLLSDIADVVRGALEMSGLAPDRLELEVTESLLVDQSDAVIEKLEKIKELGSTIAMDDFGTGYSSLAYLLKFPFDKIKIDRSFVTALFDDPAARDVLRSIVALGKTLKMNITAEGVENSEQAKFLKEVSCNQFQGYLFSKPMGAEEMAAYLMAGVAAGIADVAQSRGDDDRKSA